MERNYLGFVFFETNDSDYSGTPFCNFYPFATLEGSGPDRRIERLSVAALEERFPSFCNVTIWEYPGDRELTSFEQDELRDQLAERFLNGGLYCFKLDDADGTLRVQNKRSCTVNWSAVKDRVRDAEAYGIYPVIDRETNGDGTQTLIVALDGERTAFKPASDDALFSARTVYSMTKDDPSRIDNVDTAYVDILRTPTGYREPLSNQVFRSKNLIFHGAPGTGKSFLARRIAADIVSNGVTDDYARLSDEQRARVGFVQFHPSYDYSDFVEGLRPVLGRDGSMAFELREGVFARFVNGARDEYDAAAREGRPAKKYVFIIDEINRGEISKIFGELFFSIDPDYRGRAGEVSTQYANLHDDPNAKFCVPENVFIIGTMNDIDHSVDNFDFAMRRRFRFLELKANDEARALAILANLGEARREAWKRMKALNEAISDTDELNDNYQIGAAYFRKLGDLSYDELWTDNLEPLLREYIRGTYNEAQAMTRLAAAYGRGQGDGA